MSPKVKKSNLKKISNANSEKSPKKYSKKQVMSSQSSLTRVSEKQLQLPKDVSVKRINRKELFFEKAARSPLVSNVSQSLPYKLLPDSKTTSSENGIPYNESMSNSDPVDLFVKDWDEMEFLESSVYTMKGNDSIKTSEAVNGSYARTRKNLVKKLSDTVISNGHNKKTTMVSLNAKIEHISSNSTKSKSSPLKRLAQKASVSISPLCNKTPSESSSKSASNRNTSSFKEDRPSLLDMVKKFSASANSASSSGTSSKPLFSNSSSAFKNYMNKIRSEPPRASSATNKVSLQSLVPNSIEISLVPSNSKPTIKNSNFYIKDNNLVENILSKKPVELNVKQMKKNGQATNVKRSTERRNSESKERAAKRSKSMKDEVAKIADETIYDASLPDLDATNTEESDHISDKEISSWFDEDIGKGTEELKKGDPPNVNSTTQFLTLNSGFGNKNVINPTPFIFTTPSIPAPVSNTFIPSSVNNNLIYDVNSLYPPVVAQPSSTTVFILPVASNPTIIPNASNNMNCLPTSQPIVKVSCGSMDVDSVFKSICKNFYPSGEVSMQNSSSASVVSAETNNSTVQTTQCKSLVQTASSSSYAPQPEASASTLSNPKESDIREISTADRGALILSFFCDLMKNGPKRSMGEYKREASEVFDLLSSYPPYLSVKHFYASAKDYFDSFCFCDSSSLCTRFKLGENFQESGLREVLKKYVSFQVKEIVNACGKKPFSVKANFLYKAHNSKLSYFEKLILKKMLKNNQSVDLEELISRLFFVGSVVIFNELKKQNHL